MHTGTPQGGDRHFEVGQLTRVEGEGALRVKIGHSDFVRAMGLFEDRWAPAWDLPTNTRMMAISP